MPMPSPKYKSGGSLKKLGTEVNGISGTFSALAFDCAVSVPVPGPNAGPAITAAAAKASKERLMSSPPAPNLYRNGATLHAVRTLLLALASAVTAGALVSQAQPQSKGGEDETGPYEVVE